MTSLITEVELHEAVEWWQMHVAPRLHPKSIYLSVNDYESVVSDLYYKEYTLGIEGPKGDYKLVMVLGGYSIPVMSENKVLRGFVLVSGDERSIWYKDPNGGGK